MLKEKINQIKNASKLNLAYLALNTLGLIVSIVMGVSLYE